MKPREPSAEQLACHHVRGALHSQQRREDGSWDRYYACIECGWPRVGPVVEEAQGDAERERASPA